MEVEHSVSGGRDRSRLALRFETHNVFGLISNGGFKFEVQHRSAEGADCNSLGCRPRNASIREVGALNARTQPIEFRPHEQFALSALLN
jgi:hypothetical protein